MNIFLVQTVLIARNEDVESWMNILVVVVLAVFWALGSIIKARKQGAQNRQKEPLARKPARRPAAQTTTLRVQLLKGPDRAPAGHRPTRSGVQEARTKLAEWRAAARKFAEEADQAFRAQMAEPTPEPPPQQTLPKPGAGLAAYVREIPEFASKLSITPEEPPAPGTPETQPEEYLTDLLADYADSDQLRRAILHYEILGRPLSLREPGGSAIGL